MFSMKNNRYDTHPLVKYKCLEIIGIFLICSVLLANGQNNKLKNQPFADQKLYHLGFMVGLNAQDMILSHSGYVNNDNSVWFSEIPSYSAGFTVGIIGDRYLNHFMNLRATPTLHFGQKEFTFKEQNTGEEFKTSIRSNYLSLPVHVRFSAERINNFRPYVLAGGYISTEIGSPRNAIIKYKRVDYGLEIGLGCNIYFPFFKLSPELKFSFGLKDLIEKDRSDLTDQDIIKYTNAFSSGKTRMITLVFNFE